MTPRPTRGLAGSLTAATIAAPLTPLILLASLLVGLLAVLTIPREEEPQISVPMVDIELAVPGMTAAQAVEHVGKPLEDILMATPGVEHVYVQAQDHGLLATARFEVGSRPEDAATRVQERLQANADRAPPGIVWPKVTVRGIDDVPVLVLALSPDPALADRWTDREIRMVAERLRTELLKVPDVGQTFLVGGRPDAIRIIPDPARLAAHGVPLSAVVEAVRAAAAPMPAGTTLEAGRAAILVAGDGIANAADLQRIRLRSIAGAPVYLSDVATLVEGPVDTSARTWRLARADGAFHLAPSVSLAIAKRPGANAVTVSEALLHRLATLEGSLIPAGLQVAVTRNYGETANEKANELLFHLALATVSIVLLVGVAVGWREAAVTAIVIPTTILLTLFASNLMGYTINRVSLFALIFSIGILVDDAIVVIENIARHWAMNDGRSRVEAAIDGVAEVGNPTVVATLTVVAALLPMLFVSGLMGPYMAPIPVNASAAMIFSFFVAVVIAPWLMVRFARLTLFGATEHAHHAGDAPGGRLGALYERVATPIIATRGRALAFLLAVGIATLVAGSMFYWKAVTVKLLPFDNKSEVQIVLDMPAGTSLEDTQRTLLALADVAGRFPEVTAMDIAAGTANPMNFNGLVRHSFLRRQPHMGDILLTLAHRDDRARSSHAIALALREALAAVPLPNGASLAVVETPPGPPVLATLLAEIYGPDAETRRKTAAQLETLFRGIPFIVDVRSSFGTPPPQLRLLTNRAALDHLGVSEAQLHASLGTLMADATLGHARRPGEETPVPIMLGLDPADRVWGHRLAATPVAVTLSPEGPALVELGALVTPRLEQGSPIIFRRNGRAADMVMAELAGSTEAPIYGMLAVHVAIDAFDWKAAGLVKPVIRLNGQPEDESRPTLLWDGEWEITWVTFRDMGGAFLVALLGIYVLVVAQFRNFKVPLVILTPIPLTLVGIVIGHMLFNAPFTATSMIGFIALAGIIVRNSILLVDFINHARAPGKPLRAVLLEAGRVRFKPILLTALAAMIGAATILMDPIFQGLAISLLFGLLSSTLLTVLVIPAIYVVLRDDGEVVATNIPAGAAA
jgi:multidrug efflux pump subunit AcrB